MSEASRRQQICPPPRPCTRDTAQSTPETCPATKPKCAYRMTSNCGSGSMPSVTTSTSIN